MKKPTTLKELLKPPFIYGGNYKWDWDTYHIRADINGDETALLKVMPGADRGYYENIMGNEGWENFIKELTRFTVQALNEKWERNFGEPLRWKLEEDYGEKELICPCCGSNYDYNDNYHWAHYNYCSHCGRRLFPPEEAEND